MRGVLYARSRLQFPGVTSNPSIDFFPLRVAFSSVRLGTDGEEGGEGKGGRGEGGGKMRASLASGLSV